MLLHLSVLLPRWPLQLLRLRRRLLLRRLL